MGCLKSGYRWAGAAWVARHEAAARPSAAWSGYEDVVSDDSWPSRGFTPRIPKRAVT
jgi:hypothetical protein